jgi:tetratricopeptide (TPR) repeat protein
VRRFLARLGTAAPVVLAIDDLQWAEPLLLDLIEHLVQWGAGTPLLVLAAARPDLRETRSSLLAAGGPASDVVTLIGLDASAATRLAASVIGAEALPAAVAGRVLATSEGNPLFVAELVRMLVNDGALARDGDRWTTTVDLARLDMPPTIHALLAARIERLRPEERTVLERAAVVGRQFSRSALSHLLPHEAQPDLDARLEALRRSELVEPDTGWFLGEPALRFHHGLTRDAAYRRVLKGTRAELHARFADWLEGRVGETVEHDETIGWHLEQAHQHLRELGGLDAQGRTLGERAANRLAAAGRRALAHDDLEPAASLLGRALDRLEEADPARAEIALDRCEALLSAGDVSAAAGAIAELARFTGANDRLRGWHTCFAGQLAVFTDPQALRPTADAVAAAAETLAAGGDAAGEAKAHAVHAGALARLGKIGACEAALDRALAAARRANDRRRANVVLSGAPQAALWGPSPVTRASGRCLDVVRVLRITQGAPVVEAVALRCQAVLETLRERPEAARRMIASSQRMVEELGITQQLLEGDAAAGLIELLEGNAPAAEQKLRTAYEGLRDRGLGIDAARAGALLGRALLAQGRAVDAEPLSHEIEILAGDDLKAASAWRGVRAEALANRGEHGAAVVLARAAVDIAAATDALLDHADARLALAAALHAAGRSAEAAAEEARAIELWEAKGATVLATRARRASEVRGAGAEVRPLAGVANAGTGAPGPSAAAVRRRVRPNAATASAARFEAALRSGDWAAAAAVFAPDAKLVSHTTGVEFVGATLLEAVRSMQTARDPIYRSEPIATLGESLALCRWTWSAQGSGSEPLATGDETLGPLDAGTFEINGILLIEVDARARQRHSELWADGHLGEAVDRLYQRYVDLLPDGPDRTRAAMLALTVNMDIGGILQSRAADFAADVELVDHRTLGMPPARGSEAFQRLLDTWPEVAADFTISLNEILELRPDAMLARWTNAGTALTGGGAFEVQFLLLRTVGEDGRVTRLELFDTDRVAEALARFDEIVPGPAEACPEPRRRGLIAGPSHEPAARVEVRRHVQPNAATANVERLGAAIAARDFDALCALFADSYGATEHSLGASYFLEHHLQDWRSFFADEQASYQQEPLASLGESLALTRQVWSGSGATSLAIDVATWEIEKVVLVEVDASGRRCRAEIFAADHLGDAVTRLYERYAELLPEGAERKQAASTACSVGWSTTAAEIEDVIERLTADVELIDHRRFGFEATRGADAIANLLRSLLESVGDSVLRVDDVLGVDPAATALRMTNTGTLRDGGGPFERPYLQVSTYHAGRVVRIDLFDPDGAAEALACFERARAERGGPVASEPPPSPPAMTKGRVRRLRPNAATALLQARAAAFAARDLDAVTALLADEYETVDHTTGVVYGRSGALASVGMLFAIPNSQYTADPIATLGDSLVLVRGRYRTVGDALGLDAGELEGSHHPLVEVGPDGKARRAENFAADRLGDAVARLYTRYAELLPDGPERERALMTARATAAWITWQWLDPAKIESAREYMAPGVEFVDHRRLVGFGPTRGVDSLIALMRSLSETTRASAVRVDDVLALVPTVVLLRETNFGTEQVSGGAFEREILALSVFGADGRTARIEVFDADQEAAALARVDELIGDTAERRFLTTVSGIDTMATRSMQRMAVPWNTGDWEGCAAFYAPDFKLIDRRSLIHLELDRDQYLQGTRLTWDMRSSRIVSDVIATRGNRLALQIVRHQVADADVGPSEREYLGIIEVDDRGSHIAMVLFDAGDLDAAYAELDRRYMAGEGAPYARVWDRGNKMQEAIGARDWNRLRSVFVPDAVIEDHRLIGAGRLSVDEWVAFVGAMVELRPDAVVRRHHCLDINERGTLGISLWTGDDTAGGFEIPVVTSATIAADGRHTRIDVYSLDQLDQARARFAELTAAPPALSIENAATRSMQRMAAAWAAHDWDGLAALYAPGFRQIDRRRLILLELDRQQALDSQRVAFEMRSSRMTREVLGTRGDRLALARARIEVADGDVGPSERELLAITEVDERGQRVLDILFDPDALAAAYAELDERYAQGEAAPFARAWDKSQRFMRALAARDWDNLTDLLSPEFVIEDHRPIGWGRLSGDEWIGFLRALVELRPDAVSRVDHVLAMNERGNLFISHWEGDESGGQFEIPSITSSAFAADGRLKRTDVYGLDQLDEAQARFAALRG